jgi:transposase
VFEAIVHDLRVLLRLADGRTAQPSATILDSRTLPSSPESGHRAGYNGAKHTRGSKVHRAVDTLGHRLALHVTAAHEQARAQVGQLTARVQEVTGDAVEVGFVDQGDTGDQPAQVAAAHGIPLEVVKLPEATHGLVLLPRRWVVESSQLQYPNTDNFFLMIGLTGLLHLVTLVGKFRPQAVEEKGSVCRLTSSPPSLGDSDRIQMWMRLPAVNRQRLLWLLSQLLEHQLRAAGAPGEDSDESASRN